MAPPSRLVDRARAFAASSSSRRAAARRFHARALRRAASPRDRRHLSAVLLLDAVLAVDAPQRAGPRRPPLGALMLAPAFHLLRTACLGFRHLDTAMALDRCAMPPPDDVKPKTPLRVLLRTDDVHGIQKI